VTITGIKKAEEGNELIVRLVEVEGSSGTVNLTLPFQIIEARRLNLLELPLENAPAPAINDGSVKIEFKPKEIITLGLLISDQ
jgi:alpha-mannosidase